MRLLGLFNFKPRAHPCIMNAADSPTLAEPPVRQFQRRGPISDHYSNRGSQVIDTVEAVPLKFAGQKLLPRTFFDVVAAARQRQVAILSDRERLLGRSLKEAKENSERALAAYGRKLANGVETGPKPMSEDEVEAAWNGFSSRFRQNALLLGEQTSQTCRVLADRLDDVSAKCAVACQRIAEENGVILGAVEITFAETLAANARFWRSRSELWDAELGDKNVPGPSVESVSDVLARFEIGELLT